MTGRTLSNRYLIGERVGIGGMAEVYQGQDTVLGRTVAVKVMLPQYAEDATFVARFKQEAAAAANLQSPYIVNVYDWGQDADTSFIVMEFVRGSDLKTAIQQRGAINQRKVAEIGSQVCQALSVAHGLDIIHRDIKPQNIMIQPDGNVKVMDFGIARAKNSVKTKTSAVLGTAHYISPEQAQGKELSPASDIYSLGVVLYEAATGKLPFDGPDAVSVALKQVQEAPVPPREVNPAIDANLEAIIMKAMSKDPRERFATARDMRHALNDFLAGRPVTLGGFSGAQTALIADPIPDIEPIGPYKTDKTAVMNVPAGGNGGYQPGGYQPSGRMRYVDPGDDQQKPSHRGAFIAVGVIAVIAIAAALAFVLLGRGCSIDTGNIEVPDVANKTLEQATTLIEGQGLAVGAVDYVYSDTVPEGSVVSQSPKAGSKQAEGTKINLSVSQGAEQVAVPDLSDMTADEARAALQKAGLKYKAGAAEHSDTVKENHVVRQSPKAGEKVAKNSEVTYYLSAGQETTAVPDVVGEYEGSAQSILTNAGFTVTVDYKSSSDVEEGAVISQSPKAGEKVKSGSSVNIVVSTGAKYYSASAYVNNSGAGEVSPGSTEVEQGGSVTFYITAYDGYEVSDVSDSNGNSYGAVSSVTLSNVQNDVSLSVVFEALPEPTPSSSSASAS
ncbi:MAG: Stk1 family PASTA domain-containing Ser/Thr kinase [Eggerthellaceae bacterium]|nr:Stk1 family PASTA domain-containing Ser/Thr kinase [Eggerthellaceae bacterium]